MLRTHQTVIRHRLFYTAFLLSNLDIRKGGLNDCCVVKLKAKGGEEDKVEKALRDVIPKVSKEEGTLLFNLHRKQDDPTVFMVFEKNTDMDAFMQHAATSYLK